MRGNFTGPGAAAILTAILFLVCGLGARAQSVLPASVYLKPHRMVAVEGTRRLNLFCLGHGSPTVLLDAGLGDSTLSWRQVQGRVARFTRVCSYDRAGYGFSDPRTGPSDADAAVADIHALVADAPLARPIVYVGHSIAGLYGVLLAARHPGDVAGEVLVDPSFAGQGTAMLAALPQQVREGALAMFAGQLRDMRACADMTPPLPESCLGNEAGPGRFEPALKALQRRHTGRASYIRAAASEFASSMPRADQSVDDRQLAAAAPSFGDKPLVILTHSHMTFPGVTPEQNAVLEKIWMEGHDRLAALSSRGSNTVVPGSGHHIQNDQPQAVAAAIETMVRDLRAH